MKLSYILEIGRTIFALFSAFLKWRWKREGKKEITNEINERAKENERITDAIISNPPRTDDTIHDLESGRF